MWKDITKQFLLKEEGLVLKPYVDTAGKITIGVGRNLSDVGISRDEALYLFENDFKKALERAENICRDFDIDFSSLPDNVKIVLVDMAFNMGNRLKYFRKMFDAIGRQNYKKAKSEMLNSLWAKQTKSRAKELASLMENGDV